MTDFGSRVSQSIVQDPKTKMSKNDDYFRLRACRPRARAPVFSVDRGLLRWNFESRGRPETL
eukprot:CAMPEP_0175154282 /NCGR_PEP_ID=MMETSP0087-20121206/20243_1 /TAXON_ID=136419 /ORGANISM="Unknown Unknown, Strain D1" /LENGTH=61 /DNA_ID=CAMNT_0016441129 /DNA_START=416 /DNA_END=598 /DNA_ORIENTATION=-